MLGLLLPRWSLLCVPIGVGTVIMLAGGASPARWGVHLLAGVLGLAMHLLLATRRRSIPLVTLLACGLACVLLIASSLLATGIDGVLRWHDLGSLRIHSSALFAPSLLVLAASQLASRPLLLQTALLGVQAVHLLQPDAGQATAFGAGAAAISLTGTGRERNLGVALVFAASALASWLRFDPLGPAPFVEDILTRAFGLTPIVGVAALLSLMLVPLSPYAAMATEPSSAAVARARAGLLLYFGGSLAAPLWGEFPVPLLGYGPSPIVGAFLGVACLEQLIRVSASAAAESPARDGSPRQRDTPYQCEPLHVR